MPRGEECKLDQFVDGLAGGVFEGVGDLDGTADGGHVLVGPVDAHGLVDGREEVADAGLALDDVGGPFVALADGQAGLQPAAADGQRPACGPVVTAQP